MKKQDKNIPRIHPHAAGIDVGSRKHYVAIGQGADQVRVFNSFTSDLLSMAKWLKESKIETVAMESTGSYWISLYDILDKEGIEVYLVNASHVKNVPGRKTDMKDCQWLQMLHSYGLLSRSFVPDEKVRALRSYLRLQEEHIKSQTAYIQRMQKALDQMNLKLHQVISETAGVSGLRVIRAIIGGETDPLELATLCESSIISKKHDEVVASLLGNYQSEHIFALKQSLESYDFYQQKIKDCEIEIEKLLGQITKDTPGVKGGGKPKKIRRRAPSYDLNSYLLKMTGNVDITELPGFTPHNTLQLISETGTNMSVWHTEKHFTSWLGLSPNNQVSGGKVLKKRRRKKKSRASQVFRIAARTLSRSHSSLGAFYRRIRARSGAAVANMATARKLAILFYRMLSSGLSYIEIGANKYEEQFRDRQIKGLKRKAKNLGFELQPAIQ